MMTFNSKALYLFPVLISLWMAAFGCMVLALIGMLFYLRECDGKRSPGINIKEL